MSGAVDTPIFVLGRQHSGNTMVAMILGRLPGVYGQFGEGRFFDELAALRALPVRRGVVQIAEIVAAAAQPRMDADRVLQVAQAQQDELDAAGRGWQPPLLYDRTMSALAASAGKRRWAQKATSHIFYSRQIAQALPGVKQLFLARNPFDIAASLKVRGDKAQQLRAVWAWNQGVRFARTRQQEEPEGFLLLRYEDFVLEPLATTERMCRFIAEPSSPALIDVPHVNRSDAPYTLSSQTSGIQRDRLWYHRSVLSKRERSVLRRYVDETLLAALYPELTGADTASRATWLDAVPALSACAANLVASQAKMALANPWTALDRIMARLTCNR